METRDTGSINTDAQKYVGDGQHDVLPKNTSQNAQIVPITPEWSHLLTHALEFSGTPNVADEIFTTLVVEIVDLLSARGGSFYLYNHKRELKHEASYGLPGKIVHQIEETVQTESAWNFLVARLTPVILEDIRNVPNASENNLDTAQSLNLLAQVGVITLAAFPMVANGSLLGFLGIFHNEKRSYSKIEIEDISLLMNVLAIAVLNRRLVDIRKVEDRGRDQFISALSHELRTPLTSIIGFTQIIRRKLAVAPQNEGRLAEQMDIIWTQAQRLNRLIDTFVDIANIEQGDFTLKFGKVELASVLKAAVEQTRARGNTSSLVEINVPSSFVWVRGDTLRLEQVFSHIISNALRYSPPNVPVAITLAERVVQNQVEVTVTDQGPGISEDLRGAIFERFYQAEALRSGGLGVGLYLSKTIVEAHGGKITVESGRGYGTTVSVILPL